MNKVTKTFSVSSLAAAGLVLSAQPALAGDHNEKEFDVAELFFELNDTDGDLGIHALIDGDPWKRLEIEDPREREMLDVRVVGKLRRQGLTEIFFESAEPTFDELSPQRFFRRFRPGVYEIEGKTLRNKELESETQLTHLMPEPPKTTVNGTTMAMQCDDEEPGYDAPTVATPVTIAWAPVTMSHPDPMGGGAGVQPPRPVTIHNYQVVVEVEVDVDNGEAFESTLSVVLPPGATSLTIPEGFIGQGDTFKYEVLAREESYNQTAVESCFLVMGSI